MDPAPHRPLPEGVVEIAPVHLTYELEDWTTTVAATGEQRTRRVWVARNDTRSVPPEVERAACFVDGRLVFAGRFEQGRLRQGLYLSEPDQLALLLQTHTSIRWEDGVLRSSSAWSEDDDERPADASFADWVADCLARIWG